MLSKRGYTRDNIRRAISPSDHGSFFPLWTLYDHLGDPRGSYNVDTVVAKAIDENGQEYAFTMVQKWPIKNASISRRED